MSNSNARAAFWADVLAPRAPQETGEELRTRLASETDLSNWAEQRQRLGLRDCGDFVGIAPRDVLAEARERASIVQRHQPTEMDSHEASRAANGIKQASDVFGCSPISPRSNPSPSNPFGADPRRRAQN